MADAPRRRRPARAAADPAARELADRMAKAGRALAEAADRLARAETAYERVCDWAAGRRRLVRVTLVLSDPDGDEGVAVNFRADQEKALAANYLAYQPLMAAHLHAQVEAARQDLERLKAEATHRDGRTA